MQKSVVDKVKDLFGSSFKKKVRKAESLKELRKRLTEKQSNLEKKIKSCKSGSEKKLLEKKIKVLREQIKKIDKKLSE